MRLRVGGQSRLDIAGAARGSIERAAGQADLDACLSGRLETSRSVCFQWVRRISVKLRKASTCSGLGG